jgi:hypothetical protein
MQVGSGDTRMHQAWGPGWPTKPRAQGVVPEGLRGVDREATRGNSHSDGWVYGPGSCCVVSHDPGVLGALKSSRNRANAATRRWLATGDLRGVVTPGVRDGNAEDQALCAELQRQRRMTVWPTPRRPSHQTAARQRLLHLRNRPSHRQRRRPRGQTIEPRQGVVKDSFALERCWMRGQRNNRWRVAAMGVAVPWHQAKALTAHRSTWKITPEI